MQKINYKIEEQKIIDLLAKEQKIPSLLLHCCCAPCGSHCITYLSQFFFVTTLFYNPNIFPEQEYIKRKDELKRFISEANFSRPVAFLDCDYCPQEFFDVAKGKENCTEGGERCRECFELRLDKTAQIAAKNNFEYVTTTLTISPLKDEQLLNSVGIAAAQKYGVKWFPSDFKKRDGYKNSILLSKQYGLYRQDYCGCVYSKHQKEQN